MQVRQRVHEREPRAAPALGVSIELGRHPGAHHQTVPALHDEERGADQRRVLAQRERARRERKRPPQDREHPVLARHVVRTARQGAVRRPAQHELARAEAQQVGEVRVAARELQDLERLGAVGNPCAHEFRDPRGVDLFAGSDPNGVVGSHWLLFGCPLPRLSGARLARTEPRLLNTQTPGEVE